MTTSPLEILYENGPVLAVVKPTGVATQAPPGIDSLELRIKQYLKQRDARQGVVYLGVPHRLDRATSGAMVFAKTRKAARKLSEQFAGRLVRKVYWALVEGRLEEEQGHWRDFVRKIPGEAKGEIVDASHPDAQLAELAFRTQARLEAATRLEIELMTGRMHQIRLQAAGRGHPVVGDRLYGSTVAFGPPADDPRQWRLALHARSLTFFDPIAKQDVTVTAPLPADWAAFGAAEDQA